MLVTARLFASFREAVGASTVTVELGSNPTVGDLVETLRTKHPRLAATLDSAMRFANLIGSMNDAFSELRSASVTPRATLHAPQTKTGTLSLIFASSSVSGGKPTP